MIKVMRLKQTCFACPSQWDGETDDSKCIYIRYRHGFLYVSVDDKEIYKKQFGNTYDGFMELKRVKEVTKEIIEWKLNTKE